MSIPSPPTTNDYIMSHGPGRTNVNNDIRLSTVTFAASGEEHGLYKPESTSRVYTDGYHDIPMNYEGYPNGIPTRMSTVSALTISVNDVPSDVKGSIIDLPADVRFTYSTPTRRLIQGSLYDRIMNAVNGTVLTLPLTTGETNTVFGRPTVDIIPYSKNTITDIPYTPGTDAMFSFRFASPIATLPSRLDVKITGSDAFPYLNKATVTGTWTVSELVEDENSSTLRLQITRTDGNAVITVNAMLLPNERLYGTNRPIRLSVIGSDSDSIANNIVPGVYIYTNGDSFNASIEPPEFEPIMVNMLVKVDKVKYGLFGDGAEMSSFIVYSSNATEKVARLPYSRDGTYFAYSFTPSGSTINVEPSTISTNVDGTVTLTPASITTAPFIDDTASLTSNANYSRVVRISDLCNAIDDLRLSIGSIQTQVNNLTQIVSNTTSGVDLTPRVEALERNTAYITSNLSV